MLLSVTIKFFGTPRNKKLASLVAYTDAELLAHYQRTYDMQAISILLERYSDAIIGVSMRYLKDEDEVRDFAGDIYLKLVDKLKDTEVRNFKAWLMTTVNNRLNDMARKGKVRKDYKNSVKWKAEESTDEQQEFHLDHHLIAAAMDSLNEKEQAVIQGLYFKDYSYKEIMDEMGLSFNQVRGIRDRATKKLRNSLNDDFESYFNE